MKNVIKGENDNILYERGASAFEMKKILACKDCKHYVQHYTLSNVRTTVPVFCSDGTKRVYLNALYEGHCIGRRNAKTVKPDAQICEHFELNVESNKDLLW